MSTLPVREPDVLLLEPASLRRLVGKLRQAHSSEGLAPSAAGVVAASTDLDRWADELGFAPPANQGSIIVLAWPPPRRAWLPADEATNEARLRGELRLQRIRRELLRQPLQDADVARLKAAIGPLAWAEATAVLKRDGVLVDPSSEIVFAREFLARAAVADSLTEAFPGCPEEPLRRLLAERLPCELLAAPYRAFVPLSQTLPSTLPEEAEQSDELISGNVVREILLRVARKESPAAATACLKARLRNAFGMHASAAALCDLANLTQGHSSSEAARCLFDLQNACLEGEKETYAVDLPGAVRALGRLAVIRPVPLAQQAALLRNLRKAADRLLRLGSQASSLAALRDELAEAEKGIAQKLRVRLRSLLADVFPAAGLTPRNLPERIGLDKLVAELSERIVEQGAANFADLRDAIARSDLKLPDLSGPMQFLGGDALLKADRQLMVRLDGVYHSGEFYLHWFHRFSTLFFGTGLGRFLTQYLALPFGGSFLVLEFLQHMVAPLVKHAAGWYPSLVSTFSVIFLGICFLALLHLPRARRLAWRLVHVAGRLLRWLFVTVPVWLFERTPLRWLLRTAWVRWLASVLLPPLLATGLVAAGLWLYQVPPAIRAWLTPSVFAASLVFLNSRPGRRLQQLILDSLWRSWDFLWVDFLPGLLRLISGLFHALLEALERLAYAVDEWLRFRQGDPTLSIVVKGLLTIVWFFVAYVLRFAIKLLVEPQINPLKHFPVVTVSHKLLLPTLPAVARLFAQWMPQHALYAEALAGALISGIPGVFGFLAWELMSNWKLYDANRSPELEPRVVGHHGETIRRLFRPGFHSGTIPTQYARLRAVAAGRARPSLRKKALHELHAVETALSWLVNWDLLIWLQSSKRWRREVPTVQQCDLATNQATLQLRSRGGQFWGAICFYWLNERLHAAVVVADEEIRNWRPAQEAAFCWALLGLLHRAGVEEPALPAVTWTSWVEVWHERKSQPPALKFFKQSELTPSFEAIALQRPEVKFVRLV